MSGVWSTGLCNFCPCCPGSQDEDDDEDSGAWGPALWCLAATACPSLAIAKNTYDGAVPLRKEACTRECGSVSVGVMHAALCCLLPYNISACTATCCGLAFPIPFGCMIHAPVRRFLYRQMRTRDEDGDERPDVEHPCLTLAITTFLPPCALWQEHEALKTLKVLFRPAPRPCSLLITMRGAGGVQRRRICVCIQGRARIRHGEKQHGAVALLAAPAKQSRKECQRACAACVFNISACVRVTSKHCRWSGLSCCSRPLPM